MEGTIRGGRRNMEWPALKRWSLPSSLSSTLTRPITNCISLSPEAPHLWALAFFNASRKCPQARPFSGTSIQVNLTVVIRLVLPNSSILGLTRLPTNFQNGGSDKAQLHKLRYTYLLGFWDFRGKSGRASTLLSEEETKH